MAQLYIHPKIKFASHLMIYISQTLSGTSIKHLNIIKMVSRNTIRAVLLLLSLSGCNSNKKESIQVFHEGSYTIRRRFVNGKRDGKSEFYDLSGKLTGIINYRDDQKWGKCIHYFSNGVVSDSVEYVCDKAQGYWRHYDEGGSPVHFNYFYFGLQFGPDLWYDKDTVLRNYYFLNFERHPIVECRYDHHGNLDSIIKVDLTVIVYEKQKENGLVLNFFAYLPRIPLADQAYYIGVIDKNKVSRKLCDIEGQNFFIDTLVSAPPVGSHLYLGCDLKANDGKYVENITVEAIKDTVDK